ncbi:DDE-type integrase/transposase/recombinase [Aminobacter aminovorans]|uniref:DDE-type integrase/transposase/recombinase n=1 Tax=Aminobacter aminovorans TaxID=83263 RepID=UPI0014048C4E|nr:DDE-type integrase/transposase/recombinase [Aminobacter aminovorans]
MLRYQRQRPGELIHVDIKTLGRIDGVGHRITGQHQGHHRSRGIGYEHVHVAIDDVSRLAYVELLPSLGREDATGILNRALAWYARLGAKVERVMTDNGSAYRSKLFAQALGNALRLSDGRTTDARTLSNSQSVRRLFRHGVGLNDAR